MSCPLKTQTECRVLKSTQWICRKQLYEESDSIWMALKVRIRAECRHWKTQKLMQKPWSTGFCMDLNIFKSSKCFCKQHHQQTYANFEDRMFCTIATKASAPWPPMADPSNPAACHCCGLCHCGGLWTEICLCRAPFFRTRMTPSHPQMGNRTSYQTVRKLASGGVRIRSDSFFSSTIYYSLVI